ncbi:MAG: degQ [Chloroflexi bacterium]|nr:degQ [Chloroflexota bacterium]
MIPVRRLLATKLAQVPVVLALLFGMSLSPADALTDEVLIHVESPSADTAIRGPTLLIQGWAINRTAVGGTGLDAIHVYLDGRAGEGRSLGAAPLAPRADVAASLGRADWLKSGFTIEALEIAEGPHTLHLYPMLSGSPALPGSIPQVVPFWVVGPVLQSEAEVAARVAPSVVQVLADSGMAGSGVRVEQGILTSEHVVAEADRIAIVTKDGRRAEARVLRADGNWDLALLVADLDLPPIAWEPARIQQQGAPLVVLGYPRPDMFGTGGQATLSRGVFSALRTMTDGTIVVQTDAAINSGNSGGPMLNMRGRLVAIAAASAVGSSGIGFGVATESIQAFLSTPIEALQPSVVADSYESDNSLEAATPLVLDRSPQQHSLHPAGDEDWFSFDLDTDDQLALATRGDCDTYIYLYGPDGTSILAEDDDGGFLGSSFLRYTAVDPGTYYARVHHFDQDHGRCGSYALAGSVDSGDRGQTGAGMLPDGAAINPELR